MSVAKNGGLTISLDGINYDTFVEVSEDILINQLKNTNKFHIHKLHLLELLQQLFSL